MGAPTLRRMRMSLLSAAILTLVLTACGGQSTPTDSPEPAASTTTVAASPTVTPTPETLTVAQAAKRYQQIVKPINDVGSGAYGNAADTYDANPNGVTRAALAKAAGQYAAALRAASDQLRSTAWPVNAQDAIDALIKGLAQDVGAANQLSRATTDDQVDQAVALFDNDGVVQAVELVREELGLPPA